MTTQAFEGPETGGDRPPLGRTFPSAWYTDPQVHARERALLFRNEWHYALPAEQVAEPGSFVAYEYMQLPLVVVRDESGVLRALINSCRHRGFPVAEGCGKRRSRTLQCPYHQWTYNLDGTLRRAPRSGEADGFDVTRFSLAPASVFQFGPLILVNPQPDAAPPTAALAELTRLMEDGGQRFDKLRRHSISSFEIAANWKTNIDNYLECYHCPGNHRDFSSLLGLRGDELDARYDVDVPGFYPTVVPMRKAPPAERQPYPMTGGPITQGQFHVMWPATTFGMYPGPFNLQAGKWVPLSPTRTLRVTEWYFAEDTDEDLIARFKAWAFQVGDEDQQLVERQQIGLGAHDLDTSAHEPDTGVLLPTEVQISRFHSDINTALSGGKP